MTIGKPFVHLQLGILLPESIKPVRNKFISKSYKSRKNYSICHFIHKTELLTTATRLPYCLILSILNL